MKLIANENVNIEESGAVIYYYIYENDGKFSVKAEYFENGKISGTAEAADFSGNLGDAFKLYGMLIKHKITPIDLEYVIEDMK